jgi:hypothetical protein
MGLTAAFFDFEPVEKRPVMKTEAVFKRFAQAICW